MKIIDYVLLEINNSVELSDDVNDHIQQGYEPYGSPFSSVAYVGEYDENVTYFYQAMIKKGDK